MVTIDITVVNVALPNISAGLGASLDGLQWVVNAYTLAYAALLLIGGSLADRLGRRLVFATGIALFTASSIACGAAPNLLVLEIARALQGCGAALVFPTALALLAVNYEGEARRRAVGLFGTVIAAAASVGPLVGGAITQSLNWRWIFLINVPLGVLMVAGALLKLREVEPAAVTGRIDVGGAVCAVVALFSLNYALLTGPEQGWTSTSALIAFVVAVIFLGLFVRVELTSRNAMIDVSLFSIPSFSGAMVLSLIVRISSFGVLPFIVLWLQGVLGYSPFDVGLRLLAMTLAILLVAPNVGRLQNKLSAATIIASGLGLAVLAFLLLVRIDAASDWTVALPGLVLLGAGIGLSYPPLMTVAVSVAPPERAGMASGAVNTFFPLGTAVGVAVFGAIFAQRVDHGLTDPALAALSVPAGSFAGIRQAVKTGHLDALGGLTPAAGRQVLSDLSRQIFTAALSQVMVAAGVFCVLGVVTSLLLMRGKRDANELTTA